jgi:phytoene/squalene synthetase
VSDGENEQAAREAVTLAYAFWRALASDDDSALPPSRMTSNDLAIGGDAAGVREVGVIRDRHGSSGSRGPA